ncbi:hypothetical protein VE03_06666 [Pseudogymnoascus sp. 23342-1-I1]|nr:hypothetical protein VE03_06666 [Pseudogymnoascus sp. 23342-1-I1]
MTTPRYPRRGTGDFEYGATHDQGRNEGAEVNEAPERGGRRRKIAGYLKAANELRQSYQTAANAKWEARKEDEDKDPMPGSFPDVSIVRHGHEELILFPSYCKRHVKRQPGSELASDDLSKTQSGDSIDSGLEWWKGEWEKHEDDKAIVDVDVRGWVYTPHRGPMNRKNRILLGLARQLSGVPAPKTPKSREGSPERTSLKARHEAHEAQRDEERIAREAEEIMRKGEDETEVAARGGYSEGQGKGHRVDSMRDSRGQSRGGEGVPGQPLGSGNLSKRSSWNQPADMSPEELKAANTNLMTRIMPFLTNPLVSTPITVFFYDNKSSQSKTVTTNESGHFDLRAALDFVPTHIRVLASENLSATEEVKITEPKGVSVISDVDDTIKHSSISSGARTIFRNAFIRDLSDLTIDGVKEWYNQMYDMGVGIHYVSNSPWQLFPVLATFFQTAGLPPGSYHLKQYSGMLQGIFEPVAERKKGTLERILRDFPERKFLLVGDSGEADLEVYTDVVLANPGRIIGVFIRDVTTPIEQPFFDESYGASYVSRRLTDKSVNSGQAGRNSRIAKSDEADRPDKRPPLPARATTRTGPIMGDLIDFGDEPDEAHKPSNNHPSHFSADLAELESPQIKRKSVAEKGAKAPAPPPRPIKPLSLRSRTLSFENTPHDSRVGGRPAEPSHEARQRTSKPNNPLPNEEKQKQQTPSDDDTYISAASAKAAEAYNALPNVSSYVSFGGDLSLPQSVNSSSDNVSTRQALTAKAASYAASASNRISAYRSSRPDVSSSLKRPDSSDSDLPSGASTPPINKKLELWNRRWARANELLGKEGVTLVKWRKGDDVADRATQLVKKAMKEMGVEGHNGADGKGKTGKGGGEAKVKDLKN